jgi:cell division transport system permease protein
MRAGFVVTEVLNGFRRNITMTIAMILTTAISLGLLGGGLIIARMTDQMKQIFGNKVEVTIYLTTDQSNSDPNCLSAPCTTLLADLQANSEVSEARFESKEQAFQRYQ